MSALLVARALVAAGAAYAVLGALFAPAFVLRGAQRLDPVARTGTRGFRLLLLPGAALLWPVLAWRWGSCARERAGARP